MVGVISNVEREVFSTMILYGLAVIFFIGSWFLFSKKRKKPKFDFLLLFIMLGIPVFFHIIGLGYAGSLDSQGAAFTSAFLIH